ncbi:MAG: MBL fold metallo-hydrolase [Erysipelotrichaceae bacterium]|nr:MBL fold metallo-hydrolase [Erysipelotrichaceae bacterium]
MKFTVLASGSKGNCSLIETENTRIIIDAGAGKKYCRQCFDLLGVDYEKCDGLLLTHSHSDHIKSIEMFEMLDIYAPFEVMSVRDERFVVPLHPFTVGDLTIMAFPLSHDVFTVGYLLFDGTSTLCYLTDTGYVSKANRDLIRGADYYVFESNYDLEMLMNSDRPLYLKQRINSDVGHLSNEDSSDILCEVITQNTKEIVLAHISQECNDPEIAYYTLRNKLINRPDIRIGVAKQNEMFFGGDVNNG